MPQCGVKMMLQKPYGWDLKLMQMPHPRDNFLETTNSQSIKMFVIIGYQTEISIDCQKSKFPSIKVYGIFKLNMQIVCCQFLFGTKFELQNKARI